MESSVNNDPNTRISRLSTLPEHLLLHILSFLPTIDAVKTSSVSRRWRNLWCSIPSLYFSYDLFPPSETSFDTRRRFANSVNHTLLHRHPQFPLTSFRVQFDFKEADYYSVIDSWIICAIDNQVIDFEIDFYIDRRFHVDQPDDEYYDFPFYALRKGAVRVVKITRCYLSLPECVSSGEFVSIRSLILEQIELSDEMVSDLVNGCSNLESLTLENCYGMDNVKIQGLKIETLSLRYFYGDNENSLVEIACPNLRLLDIDNFQGGKYLLKDSSALVEASVCFWHRLEKYGFWSELVSLLGHVKKFTVQNWWYKLLAPKDVASGSLKFHHLQWLQLQTGYSHYELLGIAALLEMSPNLDTLVLEELYKDEDEGVPEDLLNSNKPINLSLPRLRQVKMKDFEGTENERLFLSLLKQQGAALQEIVVVPRNGQNSYTPVVWFKRT